MIFAESQLHITKGCDGKNQVFCSTHP